jgi:hypothetical protein
MATTLAKADTTMRFRAITRGVSVHDVADSCREAVQKLLVGVASGWSEVDLELWLGDAYRSVTSLLGCTSGASRTTFSGRIDRSSHVLVEASLLAAGDQVREMLASCSHGPQPHFVAHAVECGFVTGATDQHGTIGFVPVDAGDMDLVERLASLIAADFLTRPNDYRSLTICEDCGHVSFECAACEHEIGHVPCESGVVRSDGASSSYAAIFPPRSR